MFITIDEIVQAMWNKDVQGDRLDENQWYGVVAVNVCMREINQLSQVPRGLTTHNLRSFLGYAFIVVKTSTASLPHPILIYKFLT